MFAKKTKLDFKSLTISGGPMLLFIYTVQETGCEELEEKQRKKYNPWYQFYYLSAGTIAI